MHPKIAGKDGNQRFLREAKLLSKLNHPNIVQVRKIPEDLKLQENFQDLLCMDEEFQISSSCLLSEQAVIGMEYCNQGSLKQVQHNVHVHTYICRKMCTCMSELTVKTFLDAKELL